MCGRYALTEDWGAVIAAFGIHETVGEYAPNDDVAPGQMVAALVAAADGHRRAGLVRWGLPRPGGTGGGRSVMINARSETVFEKPTFRRLMARRRCLIPASSYYEWKAEEDGRRRVRIRLAQRRLFAFAGLYDVWVGEDGARSAGCVILTREPNAELAAVHDRMPVILRGEDEALWLDPTALREDVASLLRQETEKMYVL